MFRKLMRTLYRHRILTAVFISVILLVAAASVLYSQWQQNQLKQQVQEERLQTAEREQEKEQKLHREMLVNRKIQSETEQLSMELGRRFLQQQTLLLAFSDAIASEMEPEIPNIFRDVPLYMNEDFAPDSKHVPPGLVHNKHIYKNPFTLEYGTYYSFNKDLTREKVQEIANRLYSLRSLRSAAISINIFNNATSTMSRQRVQQHGSLTRQIIVLLNNGLAINYPGMYYPAKSQDDFLSDYIRRERRAGRSIMWSPPFKDHSGHTDISCWRGIFDSKGKQIGTIGFNVCYEQLLQPIHDLAESENGKIRYMLVDNEDHLIFTTGGADDRFSSSKNMDSLFTMSGLYSFRHPQVIRRIKQPGAPSQFDIKLDGKDYRISWSKIPFADWLLIQRVALEDLDSIEVDAGDADHQ